MSRGPGRVQRACLDALAKHKQMLTMEIAAEIFQIQPDANGDQWVSDAQHVSVKRALEDLRRKGLVYSRTVNRLRGYGLEWSTEPITIADASLADTDPTA